MMMTMMNNALSTRRRGLFRRRLVDRCVRFLSTAALFLAVAGMGWILWNVCARGISVLSWSFLTEPAKPWGIPDSGIANAILGTLEITFGAALIGIPPALLGGIYLAEFGRGTRLAGVIRLEANVLMGMPSVVVGLFVYAVMVVPLGGFSGMAGSLALAILMIPVVLSTTEEMLRMVPDTLRESALALGCSRARATLAILCRSARSGLLTGILLAVARVSGETAPLLFTALWSDGWPRDYFTGPTANLPVLITEYSTNSPFAEQHAAGWGAALTVTAMVLILNVGSRIIFKEKHHVR